MAWFNSLIWISDKIGARRGTAAGWTGAGAAVGPAGAPSTAVSGRGAVRLGEGVRFSWTGCGSAFGSLAPSSARVGAGAGAGRGGGFISGKDCGDGFKGPFGG